MKSKHMMTNAVHAGARLPVTNDAEAMPIYQTSVFTFRDLNHLESYFDGNNDSYLYSRNGNPNVAAFEKSVAALEGGETGVAQTLCGH